TGNGSIGSIGVSGDLDFGSNDCGGTAAAAQTVTISNPGNAAFTFEAALAGGAASPYTFSPASGTVPAQGSVSITVTPKAIPAVSPVPGTYGDSLVITPSGLADNSPKTVALTQSARGAIITTSKASVPFGLVTVGKTSNSDFTLVNAGNAPIDLTLALTGAAFGVTPASVTVAPGANQSATASFSPQDISPQQGSIALQAGAGAVLCQPLPSALQLSGQGQNGGVSFNTTSLDFGQVNCGATGTARTFVLTNSGNAPLTWSGTLGNQNSPYTFSPTTSTVAAGDSVTITVTPKAIPATSSTADNAFGDELTILTDVVGDQAHVISLKETARGAVLAFQPATLGFGSIAAGTTSQKAVQLVNSGNAGVGVTYSSTSAAFTTSPTSGTAPAGGASTVNVTFVAPAAPGAQSGTVNVSVGVGEALCAPVPAGVAVTGTSTTGQVGFSPSSLDFGQVLCGKQGAAQTITFTNTGNADYKITAPVLSASAPYTVAVSPADLTVKAGGTLTVTVTPKAIPFPSPVPGSYGGTLTIGTTVAGDTAHEFPLTESAQGAILSLVPVAYGFGSVPVNSAKVIQYTVTNSGNLAATVAINNNNNASFTFGGATVNGGSSVQGNAQFLPTQAITYNGTATLVASNTTLCQALATNTQAMAISGTGTATSVITVAPASLAFGAVGCGTTADAKTVVISNGSASPVTFTTALNFGTAYDIVPATGSVPANGTFAIQIKPKAIPVPSTPGAAYNDTLTITTDDPQN
ncbi:MAG: choice-of-anchor D domain-containing protein, partial [Myxococcales bacterium]